MAVKYYLKKSSLKGSEDKFTAQVVEERTLSAQEMIDESSKKGTTLTKTDLLAANELFNEFILESISKGQPIQTDLFHVSFSIKGTFESNTEGFSSGEHSINLKVNPTKRLKEAIEKIGAEKVSKKDNAPLIQQVIDATTKSTDSTITPNGILDIIGDRLKIGGDSPEVGVYFIGADGTRHKVQVISNNQPSKLTLQVPTLTAGEYSLEVTTQEINRHININPRSDVFELKLNVL